jgi:hypothetical protein
MVFPSLGVNQMEGFLPSVEAVHDERAKDAVVFVQAVKERTIVTVLAEGDFGNLCGSPGGIQISPPRSASGVDRATL